ncbi:MAG: hypothetical protein AB7I18_05795 [Candidatus Berkiella sp.]
MMIKIRTLHLNIITVFASFFLLIGIVFGFLAASGVVIVVTFFSKIFFALAFMCILFSVILFLLRKKVKVTEVK